MGRASVPAAMIRRALVMVLPALLIAGPANAQDDDLVPLTPIAPKPKPKAKPKPKPKPKPVKPVKAPTAVQDDDLVPLTPMKTEVLVKLAVEVPGAKLLIDGKEVGTLPQPPQEVSAGEHTVTVKRPGFAPFTKKVTVGTGKTAEVSAELKATMAVLSITSEPSGAQLYVAGKPVGTSPVQDLEVPPGFVTVTAKKEGHTDAKTELVAKAGRDHPVSLKLGSAAVAARPSEQPVSDRPEATNLAPDQTASRSLGSELAVTTGPPIVTRWYFWVGVVAVAGAIVAGTAIGVSQANANRRLTAEEICGEPCVCINCSGALKF